MPVTLYATIKRSSKYRHQQPRKDNKDLPFPVQFTLYLTEYCILGNENTYRLRDVWLYVWLEDNGTYMTINS